MAEGSVIDRYFPVKICIGVPLREASANWLANNFAPDSIRNATINRILLARFIQSCKYWTRWSSRPVMELRIQPPLYALIDNLLVLLEIALFSLLYLLNLRGFSIPFIGHKYINNLAHSCAN